MPYKAKYFFNSFPTNVQVVAVSKGQPMNKILGAIDAGFTHFGESRIEEIEGKWIKFPKEKRKSITLHMIGHVQSRKAEKAAALCDWVDSVDSLKLAQKLDFHAGKLQKRLNVLIQVNNSGETAKSGYEFSEKLEQDLLAMHAFKHITVRGFMTIAPLVGNPEDARFAFRKLAKLRTFLSEKYPQLTLEHLSMGMTNDYQVALEEGATMVRIGRGLFLS